MIKQSINLTDTLTLLIHEIVKETEEFKSFDVNKILICCSENRTTGKGGIYGKLLPMRFENGVEIVRHKDLYYTIPKVKVNNIEMLYILYFYIPKFFDLSPEKKIHIIFHELYHINPDFNGDIRRMGKVKTMHGHSKKEYDKACIDEAEKFYCKIKETSFHAFLELNSIELKERFAALNYKKMKKPKPVIINMN